jgi:sugar phosphate permease
MNATTSTTLTNNNYNTTTKTHPPSEKCAKKRSYAKYAWVVLAMNGLFLFYKYVLQVSPSVMTDDLMRQFHVSGAGLGNLAATYFYTYLVTQLFAGPLLDRYSPRLLTTGALFLCALGMLGFAHSESLFAAQTCRGLVGVGAAFATVSYLKLAANWFPKKQYAFVAGLLASAVGVGALAGETPLAMMVNHLGWRSTLTHCGFLGMAVALVYFVFVRNKPKQELAPKKNTAANNNATWRQMLSVVKSKKNWLLTFYSGLAFSPLAVFGGLWGTPFLQTAHHLSKTQAAEMVTLTFVGLGLGAPFFGWLSDRLGKRLSVMCSGTVLSAAALVVALYLSVNSLAVVACSLFLFGFGTGSFMLGFSIGKESNPLMLAATVIAMVNTGDALFGSVTEPLVGKMLDLFWNGKVLNGVHVFSTHDYYVAFSLLPVYLLASLGFAFFLRENKSG